MASSFFTLPAALGLLLLACVHVIRYLRGGPMRDAVVAGLYALGLAAVHQYDLVTFGVVAGLWTLLAGRRYFGGMAVAFLIPAPYVLYSLAVVTAHALTGLHGSVSEVGGALPAGIRAILERAAAPQVKHAADQQAPGVFPEIRAVIVVAQYR